MGLHVPHGYILNFKIPYKNLYLKYIGDQFITSGLIDRTGSNAY